MNLKQVKGENTLQATKVASSVHWVLIAMTVFNITDMSTSKLYHTFCTQKNCGDTLMHCHNNAIQIYILAGAGDSYGMIGDLIWCGSHIKGVSY